MLEMAFWSYKFSPVLALSVCGVTLLPLTFLVDLSYRFSRSNMKVEISAQIVALSKFVFCFFFKFET